MTAATASKLGVMNGAVPPPHGAFDLPPHPWGGGLGHQRHFCGIRESDKRHLTCSSLFTPSGPGQVGEGTRGRLPADTRGLAAERSALLISCKSATSALSLAYTCERLSAGHPRGSSCCLISPSQPSPERGLEEAGRLGSESGGLGLPPFLEERLRKGRAARRRGRQWVTPPESARPTVELGTPPRSTQRPRRTSFPGPRSSISLRTAPPNSFIPGKFSLFTVNKPVKRLPSSPSPIPQLLFPPLTPLHPASPPLLAPDSGRRRGAPSPRGAKGRGESGGSRSHGRSWAPPRDLAPALR